MTYSLIYSHTYTFLYVQSAALITVGDNRAYHLINIITNVINNTAKENKYLNQHQETCHVGHRVEKEKVQYSHLNKTKGKNDSIIKFKYKVHLKSKLK